MNYRQKKKRLNMICRGKKNTITTADTYIDIIDLETDKIKYNSKLVNEVNRLLGTDRKIFIVGHNPFLNKSFGVYIDKGVPFDKFWVMDGTGLTVACLIKSRHSNKVYAIDISYNIPSRISCGELEGEYPTTEYEAFLCYMGLVDNVIDSEPEKEEKAT